jgi:hypothetical protein
LFLFSETATEAKRLGLVENFLVETLPGKRIPWQRLTKQGIEAKRSLSMPSIPLTAAQRATFESLLYGPKHELALLSCSLYGDPIAVICRITPNGDEYILEPLYVEVSPTLATSLLAPNDEPLLNLEGIV